MPMLFVAGASADVKHSRRGSAILGGQQSLVERGTAEGIVVEGGEEAGQVAEVVDGYAVVEYGVLR